MVFNPIRADEYRARAAAEAAAGAATTLEQVRAKHTRAATVWSELADAEDHRASERARRVGALALAEAALAGAD